MRKERPMNPAETKAKGEGKTEAKAKKERSAHSAKERCEAVLAVWTERRRPAQVCRRLGVSEGILMNWQDRALGGMLEALEPQKRLQDSEGPLMPAKLERKLIRQAAVRESRSAKLQERLARIQAGKPEAKPA